MRIAQFKKTPIALAPDELAKAINKYSDHHSEVFGYGRPGGFDASSFDIICTHNRVIESQGKPLCILYHSEPLVVDLTKNISHKMVVAQYQATLPEFQDCKPMRNLIDFDQDLYKLKPELPYIRIGFSPSRKEKMGHWHDKGYSETIAVLERIKKKHNVEVDIITDVPLHECIRRKSLCNILIDECVTGSYHRSGLEGLALGKLTICNLSPQVNTVLQTVSRSNQTPFYNVHISALEIELDKIIDAGSDYINETGLANRQWMETHWHPKDIVQEFIQYYENVK